MISEEEYAKALDENKRLKDMIQQIYEISQKQYENNIDKILDLQKLYN